MLETNYTKYKEAKEINFPDYSISIDNYFEDDISKVSWHFDLTFHFQKFDF